MKTSASYDDELKALVEVAAPSISGDLSRLPHVDPTEALRILDCIFDFACRAQNVGVIFAGRRCFAALPREWVEAVLIDAVSASLNLDDEWEYRRLLEMLLPGFTAVDNPGFSSLLEHFIRVGLESSNGEIVDAAQEFRERRDGTW